jgi:hypothetical protein
MNKCVKVALQHPLHIRALSEMQIAFMPVFDLKWRRCRVILLQQHKYQRKSKKGTGS